VLFNWCFEELHESQSFINSSKGFFIEVLPGLVGFTLIFNHLIVCNLLSLKSTDSSIIVRDGSISSIKITLSCCLSNLRCLKSSVENSCLCLQTGDFAIKLWQNSSPCVLIPNTFLGDMVINCLQGGDKLCGRITCWAPNFGKSNHSFSKIVLFDFSQSQLSFVRNRLEFMSLYTVGSRY